MTMLKILAKTAKKRSPEILTAFGILGMTSSIVMAIRATPKAMQLIEERKKELETDKLQVKETVKITYKYYVPSIITWGLSVVCFVCADRVHVKRSAALAAAFSLAESKFATYKNKVIDTIGEKKEQEILDAIAKDKITKNKPAENRIIDTGVGSTLCYDAISGRYFKSDVEKIRRAINNLNFRLMDEMYIPLNDFYYEIGLEETKLGDELGWNIDIGLIDLELSAQLTDNDIPCLVLDYGIAPRYDFRTLH